ncbi:MAG: hypothetical protein AAGH78_15795 [Cyanobacteria bacterium P01_H01_bin.58]
MAILSLKTGAALALTAVGMTLSAISVNAQTTDVLYTGETGTYENYLEAGDVVSVTCDSDCTDIDAYMYGAEDELADYDNLDDANPVVIAPYSGTFTLDIEMISCAVEPCEIYID